MKFENAYIISYKSPKWTDKQLKKREETHAKQVEWFKSQGFNVFIFAQYEPVLEGVTYLPWDGKHYLPGNARNVCLRHFYESDSDYCILADDDGWLADKTVYSGPIKKVLEAANPLNSPFPVGLMCPILPQMDPYGEFLKKYGDVIKHSLVLRNRPHQAGIFLILKNLKKHHNDPVFFREDWAESDGSVKYGEDAIFSMEITKRGYGSYKLWNYMCMDYGTTNSSHAYGVQEQSIITQRHRAINLEVAELFGLRVTNSGTDQQRVFFSEFGYKHMQPKEFLLPFDSRENILDMM